MPKSKPKKDDQPLLTPHLNGEADDILELIFSSIHTGIAYLDPQFNFIWVNQGYATATGHEIDFFHGKNYFQLFPDPEMQSIFRQVVKTGGTYSAFNKPAPATQASDDRQTFWDWRLQTLRDPNQTIKGIVLLLEDVTLRAMAEKALHRTQAMFAHLFESAPDANILVDRSGNIVALNRQTESLFGYSRHELTGKPIETLVPDSTKKAHQRQRQDFQKDPHLRQMGAGLDLFGRKQDGTEFPVDVTLCPLETEQGLLVLAVVRDITRRKKADLALKQSEERFRNSVEYLLEAFTILTAVRDEAGQVVDFQFEYANQIARQSNQSLGENMLGKRLTDMLPKLKRSELFDALCRVVETGQPLSIKSIDYEDTWGNQVPFQRSLDIRATRLGDGIAASWRDVTEDRRMEAALRQQEALLRTVVDTLPVGVWVVDRGGQVVLVNQAGLQIWGGRLQPDLEQTGGPRAWWRRSGRKISPEEWPIHRAISHGESLLEEEIDIETPDGRRKTILNSTVPLKDEHGQVSGAVMVSQEITERKRMEAELSEVQRRLMDGIELERRRLAQELHDGPIQDLYGIAFQLQGLDEEVTTPAGKTSVEEARAETTAVVQVLREICGELRPPTLVHFGLKKAIIGHIEKFGKDHPEITIGLHLVDDRTELPEPIRLALFRIYQHSMSNIARHAHADHIDIHFDLIDRKAVLEIADNGVGFEVPRRWIKLAREGHLGLIGSVERAESVGGKLEIESAPGRGTLIRAIVPLPRDNTVTAEPVKQAA